MIEGVQDEANWTEEMVTFPARYLVEARQTIVGMMALLERIEGSADVALMHRHAHRARQGGRALLGALEPLS